MCLCTRLDARTCPKRGGRVKAIYSPKAHAATKKPTNIVHNPTSRTASVDAEEEKGSGTGYSSTRKRATRLTAAASRSSGVCSVVIVWTEGGREEEAAGAVLPSCCCCCGCDVALSEEEDTKEDGPSPPPCPSAPMPCCCCCVVCAVSSEEDVGCGLSPRRCVRVETVMVTFPGVMDACVLVLCVKSSGETTDVCCVLCGER